MRFIITLCVLTLIADLHAAEAKLAQIQETRAKQLIEDENSFPWPSGLSIKLRISGDDVKGATSYGKLNIAEAVDDLGTDLKPQKDDSGFSFGFSDEFQPIQRFDMSMDMGIEQDKPKEEPDHFDVELQLQAPPRKATQLKHLKGELQVLTGGEKSTITLINIPSHYGKQIDDPALTAAGLAITVLDPKTPEAMIDGNGIALKLKGKTDALGEVQITNAAGESISRSSFGGGVGDEKTTSYDLEQPLDDKVTMKIDLMVNQTTVTVPFEVRDVELP